MALLRRVSQLAFLVLTIPFCTLGAEPEGDGPRICVMAPLGIVIGSNTTVSIRGLKLADATEVFFRTPTQSINAKIKEKKTVELPTGLVAKDVGDSLVIAEVAVPSGLVDSQMMVSVVTSAGITRSFAVQLVEAGLFMPEGGANNGFLEAQPIAFGKRVFGTITPDRDVDVFAITGHAKKNLVAEVRAMQVGSLLDGVLTLYDAKGWVLATHDDRANTRDPQLRFTFPVDGTYFLALQDANDRGTAWHGYELRVQEEP